MLLRIKTTQLLATLLFFCASPACKQRSSSAVRAQTDAAAAPQYSSYFQRQAPIPPVFFGKALSVTSPPQYEDSRRKVQQWSDQFFTKSLPIVGTRPDFPLPKVVIIESETVRAEATSEYFVVPISVTFEKGAAGGAVLDLLEATHYEDAQEMGVTKPRVANFSADELKQIRAWLLLAHSSCYSAGEKPDSLVLSQKCWSRNERFASLRGAKAVSIRFASGAFILASRLLQLRDSDLYLLVCHELGHMLKGHIFALEQALAMRYPYKGGKDQFSRTDIPEGLAFSDETAISLWTDWLELDTDEALKPPGVAILNKLRAANISDYSQETQADELALFGGVIAGLERNAIVNWLFAIWQLQLDVDKSQLTVEKFPGTLNIDDCKKELAKGFPVPVSAGLPSDIHHSFCYRIYQTYHLFPAFHEAYSRFKVNVSLPKQAQQ